MLENSEFTGLQIFGHRLFEVLFFLTIYFLVRCNCDSYSDFVFFT